MNYIEALQALVDGKKIKKKDWADPEYYFIADNKIYNSLGMECFLSINDEEELTEDTWEIYMDERDKLITDGKRWKLYMCCHNCKSCLHCEGKQEELYRLCTQDNRVTAQNVIKNLSNDEVDKLYNTLKGEIDA